MLRPLMNHPLSVRWFSQPLVSRSYITRPLFKIQLMGIFSLTPQAMMVPLMIICILILVNTPSQAIKIYNIILHKVQVLSRGSVSTRTLTVMSSVFLFRRVKLMVLVLLITSTGLNIFLLIMIFITFIMVY